jgi:hypothetical protein
MNRRRFSFGLAESVVLSVLAIVLAVAVAVANS